MADPAMAMNRARAFEFLLRGQAADGGIRSTTYGPLKAGAATTALVLYAAAHLPEAEWRPHRQSLQRACDFLRPGIARQGAVAAPDGTLDYPTYGSAMLLLAAERLQLELPSAQREQLVQHLVRTQLTAKQGVQADSIHHGGWDLDAARGARGERLQGSNISLAAFALEALSGVGGRESGVGGASGGHKPPVVSEVLNRALHWVLRCQNADGGFVFHALRSHPGNKAKWSDEEHRQAISYATPTCDGLRCLKYCGLGDQDEPVQRTVHWVEAHPEIARVPGFDTQAKDEGWDQGLRYYYFFTQAKALPLLSPKEAKRRATEICNLLAKAQRPDGSFQNEQPRMFEDDPLLATSLAIIADAEAERSMAD